jgi:hypothetical protein
MHFKNTNFVINGTNPVKLFPYQTKDPLKPKKFSDGDFFRAQSLHLRKLHFLMTQYLYLCQNDIPKTELHYLVFLLLSVLFFLLFLLFNI